MQTKIKEYCKSKNFIVFLCLICFVYLVVFTFKNFNLRQNTKQVSDAQDLTKQNSHVNLVSAFSNAPSSNHITLPFSELYETASVNAIESDANGTLWIATEQGITSISSDRNTIKHYSQNEGTFPFAHAKALAFDGQTLWVGSLFGLAKLSETGRFVISEESEALPSNIIWDMLWDKNTLWIATQLGVSFKTSNNEFQTLTDKNTNKALKNNWCKKMAKIQHWFIVYHDSGISIWNTNFPASRPDIWKNMPIERVFVSRTINDLATDEKYLWLATPQGLFRLEPPVDKFFNELLNKFNSYTKLNGLASNNIQAIVSHKNAIWAGTAAGLARIANEQVNMIYPMMGVYHKNIKSLHAAGDILWLGTDKGVQFINTAMVGQND